MTVNTGKYPEFLELVASEIDIRAPLKMPFSRTVGLESGLTIC